MRTFTGRELDDAFTEADRLAWGDETELPEMERVWAKTCTFIADDILDAIVTDHSYSDLFVEVCKQELAARQNRWWT